MSSVWQVHCSHSGLGKSASFSPEGFLFARWWFILRTAGKRKNTLRLLGWRVLQIQHITNTWLGATSVAQRMSQVLEVLVKQREREREACLGEGLVDNPCS